MKYEIASWLINAAVNLPELGGWGGFYLISNGTNFPGSIVLYSLRVTKFTRRLLGGFQTAARGGAIL